MFKNITTKNQHFLNLYKLNLISKGVKILVLLIAFQFYNSTLSAQTKQLDKITSSKSNTTKVDSLKKYVTPTISVTSTKAQDRVNSIPFSDINKDELEQIQTNQDLPMLLNNLPSVVSYSENGNGVGYSNISIRGFDQRRIAVLVNGIPQNDPEDHNLYWINYTDLSESMDNIQVQRGAGMINYGAAAIAGSINLNGINFTRDRYIKLSTGGAFQELGNDAIGNNTSKLKFEYSSGLIDEKYAVYGKLSRINSWGYRDQSFSFMNTFYLSAIRYDENLSTQINVYGGSQRDGLAYYGIPKSHIGDLNLRRRNYNYWEYDTDGKTLGFASDMKRFEVEEFSSPHYEILNNYKINENIDFSSSLFYFTGSGYFDFSGAGWTDAKTFRLRENGWADAEDPRNPVIRAFVSNKQGGWIPKINIKHDNGELNIGAEVRIHRSEHYGNIAYAENLPSGFDQDFKFYSYDGRRNILSLFAREIYKLDEDKMINIEAQIVNQNYALGNEKTGYNYSEFKDINGNVVSGKGDIFNINYTFFNPRIGFNWNIDEVNNFYTSAAVTSREPRMQNFYQASESYTGATPLFAQKQLDSVTVGYDFNSPNVKPETMLNIELGWNYKTEDYNFSANAYLMEYFNELVSSGQLDIFGRPIDGNAERTRHFGLELNGVARILNNSGHQLFLGANATISSNRIIEYDFYSDNSEKISLNGNRIAGFSDFIANMNLRYQYENFSLLWVGKYVGDLKTDNFGDMINSDERIKNTLGSGFYADNTLDAYFVMNLFLNYKLLNVFDSKAINLQFAINNLSNNLYAAMARGRYFFAAAERNAYLGIELEL